MAQWRIYMDTCCFSRPYDDLSNAMIRMESEAIISIIDKCEQHDLMIYGSDVLLDEISRMTDKVKSEKIMMMYFSATTSSFELCEDIINRASDLIAKGIKPFDALHIASAEHVKADAFLSTDKRLLNAAKRIGLNIKAYNPVTWLLEVLHNEQQS